LKTLLRFQNSQEFFERAKPAVGRKAPAAEQLPYFVTALPYWEGAFESLPSGARREVGASFENAIAFSKLARIF
jgi:hypothetical protein